MKELFRERDAARIGYYQSLLEAEGIQTHVRNRDLVTTMGTEVPIPEFFPALCVVEDADYEKAIQLLREMADGDGNLPVDVPFQAKPVFVIGVCGLCVMLILGACAFLFAEPTTVGLSISCGLAIAAGLAGIWRVLTSFRNPG